MKMARTTGIVLSLLLAVVGYLHQRSVGFDADRTLLYISLAFAVIHVLLYASKLGRSEDKN
jgi:APA family basic amino acid/polyamine antiporter